MRDGGQAFNCCLSAFLSKTRSKYREMRDVSRKQRFEAIEVLIPLGQDQWRAPAVRSIDHDIAEGDLPRSR